MKNAVEGIDSSIYQAKELVNSKVAFGNTQWEKMKKNKEKEGLKEL